MSKKMVFALIMVTCQGFAFLNIPPALDKLMDLYDVSYTGISILMSALFWSHALMQVPAGIISDGMGVRCALMISLVCMSLGNLLPAATPSFELAVLGRVITGIGTGLSFVGGMKMVTLYAPIGRAGTYQGFFGGCFSVGSMLAYLLIPEVLNWGWQWVFLVPACGCMVCFAILCGFPLSSQRPTFAGSLVMGKVVRNSSGWVLGYYQALSWGTMITLGNWILPLLAEAWKHPSAENFAWGGVLLMLISGLGRLTGGFILLRIPPMLMANGSILILSMIFLGLFLLQTPGIVMSLALLAAWFASLNFGAIFQLASRTTASEALGTYIGFIVFLANLGAISFTLLLGWFKDHFGSFSMGFGILAFLCLVAFLVGGRTLKKTNTH